LWYRLDELQYVVYILADVQPIKRFGEPSGMGTPSGKPCMKKSNHHTKAMDSPKPNRAIAAANETQNLPPVPPLNISRERLMDGASTTTELLSEILQRQKRSESVRDWGINE
jgi:hypothetical protein